MLRPRRVGLGKTIMLGPSRACQGKKMMSRRWPLVAYAKCRDMIFLGNFMQIIFSAEPGALAPRPTRSHPTAASPAAAAAVSRARGAAPAWTARALVDHAGSLRDARQRVLFWNF